MTVTRSDIIFEVNKVCQFMHVPTEDHWKGLKRIVRYVHETIDYGLNFISTSSSDIHAFSDSD